MKKIVILLTFVMLSSSYGQELLPREREREIRTSGRYYYGECSEANEADAKECATRELIQKVGVELRRQSISSDEETIRNAVTPKMSTATLSSQAGRVRIFAWIEKDDVRISPAANVSSVSVITPEAAPTQAPSSTPTQTQQATTTVSTQPASTPSTSSTSAAISNPIIRELSLHQTFEQFRRAADDFRRDGRLTYGANKASFFNPDNCFIAVFSREERLIALLETGQGARRDLFTGNIIQNVEQHFAGNTLIWIQIRNN